MLSLMKIAMSYLDIQRVQKTLIENNIEYEGKLRWDNSVVTIIRPIIEGLPKELEKTIDLLSEDFQKTLKSRDCYTEVARFDLGSATPKITLRPKDNSEQWKSAYAESARILKELQAAYLISGVHAEVSVRNANYIEMSLIIDSTEIFRIQNSEAIKKIRELFTDIRVVNQNVEVSN